MFSVSLINEPIFLCPVCLDDCSSGVILDCSHRLCYNCFDYLVYKKDYVYDVDGKYDFNCCTCRQTSMLTCQDVGNSAYRRNMKNIGKQEVPIVIETNDDDIGTIIYNTYINIQTAEDLYSGDETEEPSEGIEEMEDDDDDEDYNGDDAYDTEEDSLWEQLDN